MMNFKLVTQLSPPAGLDAALTRVVGFDASPVADELAVLFVQGGAPGTRRGVLARFQMGDEPKLVQLVEDKQLNVAKAVLFLAEGSAMLVAGSAVHRVGVTDGSVLQSVIPQRAETLVRVADGRVVVLHWGSLVLRSPDAASVLLDAKVKSNDMISLLSVAPDARLAATGGAENYVRVFELEKGEMLKRIPVAGAGAQASSFSLDGTLFAHGPTSAGQIVVRKTTGKFDVVRELNASRQLRSLAFGTDGRLAAVFSPVLPPGPGSLSLWSADGSRLGSTNLGVDANQVRWWGQRLLVNGGNGLQVFEIMAGTP